MRKQRISAGTDDYEYVLSQYEYGKMDDELTQLRATIATSDNRLLDATDKIGFTPIGCDTADWLADEILGLRAELAQYKQNMETLKLLGSDLAHDAAIEALRDEIAELHAELASLHANDELSSKNWKRIQADNLRYVNENRTLRAELERIKPSWGDAPDNAEFLTQDEEWTWEFHENEPRTIETSETEDNYGWWGSKGYCDIVHNKNWRDTLERKPEAT